MAVTGRIIPNPSHPDSGLGTESSPWPEVHTESIFMVKETNDTPGTGVNICADGGSYIWRELATGKKFLVMNTGGAYALVELGDQ